MNGAMGKRDKISARLHADSPAAMQPPSAQADSSSVSPAAILCWLLHLLQYGGPGGQSAAEKIHLLRRAGRDFPTSVCASPARCDATFRKWQILSHGKRCVSGPELTPRQVWNSGGALGHDDAAFSKGWGSHAVT